MKGMNHGQTWLARGVMIVLLLLTTASVGQARWINLLYENYEGIAINTWPWSRSGHPWTVISNNNRWWGVEDNTIFHSGHPDHVRAMWCAGYPNDLQPGVDQYPANYTTVAYWGPFSLANAVAASGSHYLFAEMESNAFGNGDTFQLVAATATNDINGSTWDTLYVRNNGGTLGNWDPILFDFTVARENGTGDTISLLGESNLYFGIVFKADADANRGLGAFVDDLSFGYDNGLYDFERRSIVLEDPNNPDIQYQALYVGTPVRIRGRFAAHGNFLSEEVTHTLRINGEVLDSVRTQWQGSTFGQLYEIAFETLYTPSETGEVEISFNLDDHDEQLEHSEDNNEQIFTYEVQPENAPPTVVFHQPSVDGVVASGSIVDIIFEATNTPVNEQAYISLFYGTDLVPSNASPIIGALGMLVTGERDTAQWYLTGVPNGDYHILAVMDDFFHETRHIYAQGVVTVDRTSVVDESSTLPKTFAIESIYPNPFNPTVEISFALPYRADVSATWFSVDGRQVDQKLYTGQGAGRNRISWTPHNLPSGVYLLNLKAGGMTLSSKVVYMK